MTARRTAVFRSLALPVLLLGTGILMRPTPVLAQAAECCGLSRTRMARPDASRGGVPLSRDHRDRRRPAIRLEHPDHRGLRQLLLPSPKAPAAAWAGPSATTRRAST